MSSATNINRPDILGPEILSLDRVKFSYSKEPFIRDMSFKAGEAEFIGLLGSNGSGKSTVLKLLSGILKPGSGSVGLWGKPIGSFKHKDRAKLISYLPQSLDTGVPFTVEELASMGAYPYDFSPPMSVHAAIELVGLSDKRLTTISDLSGGEKRRAYIAMTLLQGAGILLLDEPLANLDVKYQIETIRLLKRLNEEKGITIIMALHDINLAMRFKSIVLIKDGRVLKAGTPEEALTEGLLKDAFGIEMRVERYGGNPYIIYGDE